MSGSAALSAARKRRASTAPSGGAIAVGPAPTGYYGRGAGPGPGPGPKEATNFIQQPNNGNAGALPPQPMNIYENIELIKHQLTERTKLIQTQGSSMPAEKVRVLQKQNEIQMQILKQKMAIAAQMENENQSRSPPAHIQESEFLYEKGVPRKNPNYRDPSDVGRVAHVPVPVPAPLHASKQQGSSAHTHTTKLSPFVSMLSDTGVIPPPVVVLKAHDIKLQEHNDILHDIVHELDDLRASMMAGGVPSVVQTHSSGGLSVIKEESRNSSRERSVADGADENAADEDEAEPEELLMEVVMNDLTNSREFVEGIVNKIVNETNLSEVIMKIEPLVKENQELRSLIHSQQQMMNEMNTMLLRLLNGGGGGAGASAGDSNTPDRETVVDGDGLFPSCEMTEIILSGTNDHVESSDVNAEAADAGVEADEEPDAEEAAEAEAAEEADEAVDAEVAAEKAEAAAEEADETEEAEADETHESDETRTLEPTDYTYDEYDKRHFIEPISLVVSEL
jgi:hypothetical protein